MFALAFLSPRQKRFVRRPDTSKTNYHAVKVPLACYILLLSLRALDAHILTNVRTLVAP